MKNLKYGISFAIGIVVGAIGVSIENLILVCIGFSIIGISYLLDTLDKKK